MESKYYFLTDSIVVRSKHKYKQLLADIPAFYSVIQELYSHAENQPF